MGREDFREKLRNMPLFEGLEDNVLAAIGSELDCIGLPGGSTLFEEGDEADALYFVTFGRLGVFLREPSGQNREIARITAGEIIGEVALISGEPRAATIVAIRDCEMLRLTRSAFDRLVAQHPTLMPRVARQLVTRLHQANKRIAPDDAPRTFLISPLDPAIDGLALADGLAKALTERGERVLCLTSQSADQSVEWFHLIEDSHDRVIYVADSAHSGWTERCVRQADQVLHIADARSPPADHRPIELLAMDQGLQSHELILFQQANASLPKATAAWLDRVPIAQHTHVRAGNRNDLGRLARLLTGRAVGVVFSSGGARGMAHFGVIRALRQAGIPIDLTGGTSVGAIAAAGAALEWSDQKLEDMVKRAIGEKNPFSDYTIPIISLCRGRNVTDLLRLEFANIEIENTWRSYFCISTNLTSGQGHVHRLGPLWRAIRASIAIPGLLPPVVQDGQVLVDGGIINNLPADIMRAQRRGPVIGVAVGPDLGLTASATELDDRSLWWLLRHGREQVPGIANLLIRSFTVGGNVQALAQKSDLDLLLTPDLGSYGLLNWKGYRDAIERGYSSTMNALEQLDGSLLRNLTGAASGDK